MNASKTNTTRKVSIIAILSAYIAALFFAYGTTTLAASTPLTASCLDSIAGYSALCQAGTTAANTEIIFKVTKPDGTIVRFPAVTNLEGKAKEDLNYYHSKQSGSYKVGAYIGGYGEPNDLPESVFRIFPDSVSSLKSTVIVTKVSVEANGTDAAFLQVVLKDDYLNPIANHVVEVVSSRSEDRVEKVNTTNITDPEGKVAFRVSSPSSGISTFIIQDKFTGTTLYERPQIVFYKSDNQGATSYTGNAFKADLLGQQKPMGGPAASILLTAPEKVQVNTPFDVSVQALDSNGEPALSYRGTVFFSSPTDSNASLPQADEGYTFKGTDDQAKHTFAKATIFSTTGPHKLVVTDVDNPDLEQEVTVVVESRLDQNNNNAPISNNVTVTSPSTGSTYGESGLDIVGRMAPSTKFKVVDGGIDIGNDISDAEGNFIFKAQSLADGKHTFVITALDAADTPLGQSTEVIVFIDTKAPVLNDIIFLPPANITPEKSIEVQLVSEPKLTKARVIIDGVAHDCTEDKSNPGTYSATFNAPAKEGEYEVKVSLVNTLGKESTPPVTKKLSVTKSFSYIITSLKAGPGTEPGSLVLTWDKFAETSRFKEYQIQYDTSPLSLSKQVISTDPAPTYTLTGLEPGGTYYVAITVKGKMNEVGPQSDIVSGVTKKVGSSKIENLKAVSEDSKISFTWDDPVHPEITRYKIEYGIRSGEYLENAYTLDNKQSWYIPDLINGIAYYFKISALDANNAVVITADEISATPGGPGYNRPPPSACTPTDVSNIRIQMRGNERILVWDALPSVTSYRIYSGTQEGVFNLPVREVRDTAFAIPFLSKEYPYYYYAVKSVCSDSGHESANFSNILKIETGPAALIVAGISIVLIAAVQMLRRRKKMA